MTYAADWASAGFLCQDGSARGGDAATDAAAAFCVDSGLGWGGGEDGGARMELRGAADGW